MAGDDVQSKRRDECAALLFKQGSDANQAGSALLERHYDRAIRNQGAVLKSAAGVMLKLAEMKGHKFGPVSHERLVKISESDPGA